MGFDMFDHRSVTDDTQLLKSEEGSNGLSDEWVMACSI